MRVVVTIPSAEELTTELSHGLSDQVDYGVINEMREAYELTSVIGAWGGESRMAFAEELVANCIQEDGGIVIDFTLNVDDDFNYGETIGLTNLVKRLGGTTALIGSFNRDQRGLTFREISYHVVELISKEIDHTRAVVQCGDLDADILEAKVIGMVSTADIDPRAITKLDEIVAQVNASKYSRSTAPGQTP